VKRVYSDAFILVNSETCLLGCIYFSEQWNVFIRMHLI